MVESAQSGGYRHNHPGASAFRKRKVAIADDKRELSELYTLALQLRGHEVVFVGSSAEELIDAQTKGKLNGVEYVVIDYRMGGMNGLDLAAQLVGLIPGVRIVIASADNSIKNQVEAVGFKFVSKPCTMSELWEAID
jgi:two-component system, NtrC family, response regulator GlrR